MRKPLIGLFLTLVFGSSGCQCLAPGKTTESAESTTQVGTVVISDGLLQGQRFIIPRQGMAIDDVVYQTLRPRYSKAGPESVDSLFQHGAALVRARSVYIVPMELIQNSSAGSIHVLPGDQLGLVNIDSLKGPSSDTAPDRTVVVLGLHVLAGQRVSIKDLENVDDLMSFDPRPVNGLPVNQAELAAAIALRRDVAELTRVQGERLLHYVIPIKKFGVAKVPLANEFALHNGDVVNFTQLQALDVVRAGKALSVITRPLEESVSGSTPTKHLRDHRCELMDPSGRLAQAGKSISKGAGRLTDSLRAWLP